MSEEWHSAVSTSINLKLLRVIQPSVKIGERIVSPVGTTLQDVRINSEFEETNNKGTSKGDRKCSSSNAEEELWKDKEIS